MKLAKKNEKRKKVPKKQKETKKQKIDALLMKHVNEKVSGPRKWLLKNPSTAFILALHAFDDLRTAESIVLFYNAEKFN